MFGFGLMDALFPVMFGLIFLLVTGLFLYGLISSIRQWKNNNASPRLTVEAEVVTKRTSVHGGGEPHQCRHRRRRKQQSAQQAGQAVSVPLHGVTRSRS